MLREQNMVAQNYYFFTYFTVRKLNVREIFLLKRGAKIILHDTGKRVKNILFCLSLKKSALAFIQGKRCHKDIFTNPAYKMIRSCNMFMKDIMKSCMKPRFSIYP